MCKQELNIINRFARAFTFLGLMALHMNAAYSQVSEIEREALLALYSALNGDRWGDNYGWKDAAVGTECTWYGVTCSNNQVSRLQLRQNNLQGTIPAEIGNLKRLEMLWLGLNGLTGQIPSQLGSLTLLKDLRLEGNKLSGELPNELSELENLEILYLGRNSLTGTLPSWLANLSSLGVLSLAVNQLSGEIPAWLGNMPRLYALNLGSNNFTGEIPEELGDASGLDTLLLDTNNLSGAIPSSLGKLVKLEILSLYDNQLTGSIPPELGNLTELERLFLYSNSLSGEIPAQLGNLINLEYLSLSRNSLTGNIPAALGNLEKLIGLYLYENSLSGSIPAELGNLVNLTALDLSSNLLTGAVPEVLYSLPKLNSFKIFNNAYVPIVELAYESLFEDSDGADGEEVTLSATAEDIDGFISESKWLFEGDVISRELSLTYRLPDGENEVLFVATDNSGRATSKAATIKVKANAPVSGSVTITGILTEGQLLVAETSTLTDEDGLGLFSYQWLRDGTAIEGEIASSYTSTASDIGKALSVTVSYTDSKGATESIASAATEKIANVNDPVIGSVDISGILEESEVLIADASSLSDLDGLGTFSYQWLQDGLAISGATNSTYTTNNSDIGKVISVTVTYTDGYGTIESISSSVIRAIKAKYVPTTAWPESYNGVAPQSALSLELNNIGLYEATSGAIATCVKIYDEGEPSEFNGVTQYDIIFSVIDEQTGNIQYTNARPFNEIEKLNSDEELPDCSGTYDIDSNIYSDTIETRLLTNLFGVALQIVKTFEVTFEIIDPANLIFQLKSYEELLAP